ncbi:MAG: hypothetical protein IJU98_06160 [Synergistaceae bacterium]|nr:hypothetical protein [Synergistaceae bacterium]
MKIMRASKVGFPCERNLWYSVNGYAEEVNERSRRIFAVGTALESVAVEWLREDGWTVDHNPGSQEAALELHIAVEGGIIAGHPDCFISHDGGPKILADIKTMNERAFIRWKRGGTLKDKPQYADQLHAYAAGVFVRDTKIDRLAVVGINKNNSAMHIDVFDIDGERVKGIIRRTERIFAATEPPEPGERMEGWCCGYCGYSGICELARARQKGTEVGEDTMKTNDPAIVDAMELLKESRELSKAGEELEGEAKAVLDERVRQQGIKSVKGGSLLLTLTESTSSRFDSKAFRKEHPDMAAEFMKSSSSVRYDVKEVA